MKISRIILLSLLVVAVVVASFGCQAAQRPEPARYDRAQDGVGGPLAEFDRVADRDRNMGPGFDWDFHGVQDSERYRAETIRNGTLGGGFNNLGLRDNADLMDGGIGRGGAEQDMTRRLEHRVEQIAGVRDATVVVEGDTVYVGLDMDRNAGMQHQGARNDLGMQGVQNNRQAQFGRTGQNQIGQAGDAQQIKEKVRQLVNQETQFRNVVVSEDPGFTRELGGIANEIRTGRPVADFGDALRDLGRALTPAPGGAGMGPAAPGPSPVRTR
ncbi:YhcN/YlaJ family sporulation lipoprotein [Desulfuribacillus alkaliarsenatis]|uniref:Sporulation protein n=1 Tax=Desulfuribacillus alkaliarsenatis TaxID=766136 RepID=A0A1E5G1L7_9FIRM|nr:YhcN/YlaJ family sporulation lipoprotein [Desulfuribacillus alkaliarsenatis]OEF96763.1 hypothetical protein BHF68_06745 [Desulfuribacillus alkaliarsenatis]